MRWFAPASGSRTPAVASGRVRDVFFFLLLFVVVRYAAEAGAHRVLNEALAPEGTRLLRLNVVYTTRSLAGLVFSIFYFIVYCNRRSVRFTERLFLDRPAALAEPAFLKSLFIFLLVFSAPDIARYLSAPGRTGAGGHEATMLIYALTGLRVALSSPLVEELVWRGFAYPIFKNAYGMRRGIVFTSLLFAAPHAPMVRHYPFPMALYALAYVFCVGAALNIIFERGANLKWCIVAHSLLNLLLLSLDILFKELVWA